MTTSLDYSLSDLDARHYAEMLALWERAGLPVHPGGRDSAEAFARQMAEGMQRVIGLRSRDGALVGLVVLTHDGRKGWINRLAVDPEYRRQGLAGVLLAAAEDWFQQIGIEVWAALIAEHNQSSRSLFASLGYQQAPVVYVSKRTRPDV